MSAEPGPGEYNQIASVNKTGIFFFKKYKNSGAPVFSKAKRLATLDLSETRKITPGPGTYRISSDFGYYNPLDATFTSSIMTGRSNQFRKSFVNNIRENNKSISIDQ